MGAAGVRDGRRGLPRRAVRVERVPALAHRFDQAVGGRGRRRPSRGRTTSTGSPRWRPCWRATARCPTPTSTTRTKAVLATPPQHGPPRGAPRAGGGRPGPVGAGLRRGKNPLTPPEGSVARPGMAAARVGRDGGASTHSGVVHASDRTGRRQRRAAGPGRAPGRDPNRAEAAVRGAARAARALPARAPGLLRRVRRDPQPRRARAGADRPGLPAARPRASTRSFATRSSAAATTTPDGESPIPVRRVPLLGTASLPFRHGESAFSRRRAGT